MCDLSAAKSYSQSQKASITFHRPCGILSLLRYERTSLHIDHSTAVIYPLNYFAYILLPKAKEVVVLVFVCGILVLPLELDKLLT